MIFSVIVELNSQCVCMKNVSRERLRNIYRAAYRRLNRKNVKNLNKKFI